MQKTISPDLRYLEMEYMPIVGMMELMAEREKLPFKTRFSFEPYLASVSSRLKSACPNTRGALMPVLEGSSKYIESGGADLDAMFQSDTFRTLVSLVVPSMFFKDDISFIAPPFTKKVLVGTSALREMLDGDKWEIKLIPEQFIDRTNHAMYQAYFYILNKFYGQELEYDKGNIVTLRNKDSLIERYFQISFKLEFVELNATSTLPELGQEKINQLVDNIGNDELWMQALPAELFEFRGFSTVNFYDISELEVLSQLKQWLNDCATDMPPDEYLDMVTKFMQSYLNKPCVKTGFIMTEHDALQHQEATSLSGLKAGELLGKHFSNGAAGIYSRLKNAVDPIVISQIDAIKDPGGPEKALLKNKIKSLILAPILNEEGNPIAVLEIGSHKSNAFNNTTVSKIRKVLDVLKSGYEKWMEEIDNRVTGIIQEKYTSIHPSVQWKFEEVAIQHMAAGMRNNDNVILDSIVFQDVYPLYAQSDIIGSSVLRNTAIQEDLVENLELLSALLGKLYKKSKMPLIDAYSVKINKILASLKINFVSNDETRIVNLLTREVHPFLEKIQERHPALVGKLLEKYRQHLDPELDIIYKRRKDFETSVNQLNSSISKFLEQDNAELQKQLPHYFEKYKTDGVEYNMYVGQSILQEGVFDKNDLRNFKLWQLINTCEIVRLVNDTQHKLSTPLETAQLIFVYNHALSIRFRMDEKRFDVDGAYNVRYEILKKRIDKAVIKGTKERLTVAGKVAIVYLNEQDRNEYVQFFEYLTDKGYIEPDFEDLELDKLQGAEGLKALRVTIK